MKKVILKIVGTQLNIDGEDPEVIEFVTEGKMYQKDGANYYVYDEGEFTGLSDCTTTVKVEEDRVKMFRYRSDFPVDTKIEFEKGKRFEGYYSTPYGPIEMEVMTNNLTNSLTSEGKGKVNIDYNIALIGLSEGRSILDIEVM